MAAEVGFSASVAAHGLPVEQELAEFASRLSWGSLPEDVQERVEDIVIDSLANAIAGHSAEGTERMERALVSLDGTGQSTVVGSDKGFSLLGATAQNAYQITAYTMCDVYRPALCHVTPEVVPAALAVAEREKGAGSDFLAALAVGLEVTTRIGRAINYPELRRRGFHSPGILGAMGAALAVARLLGFDAETIRAALGLAGSQACGTFAALGTEAVKLHQVFGARSGVAAGVLAGQGVRGSTDILTAPDGGVFSAYSNGGSSAAAVADLGEEWELLRISLRARPGSSSVQAVGEAAEMLVHDYGVSLSDLGSVEVSVPPSALAMCDSGGWADELSALQSARYVVAAVIAKGTRWVELFGSSTRADHRISRFAHDNVAVNAVDDIPLGGARVAVWMRDGRKLSAYRPCARGDPGEPLSRADIEEKLALACEMARLDAGEIAAEARQLAGAPDLSGLLQQLRPSPGSPRE